MNARTFLFALVLLPATLSGPERYSLPFGRPNASKDVTEIVFARASKATVVVFLSARCPCSASHEEALKSLQKEFEPKGFSFVGVHSNSDEDDSMAREYFSKAQFSFPIFRDAQAKWANTFGALKTPHVYVVSPKGNIVYQGGMDDSRNASQAKHHYLKDALTAFTEGKEPTVKETRALGCAIRRPD